jgi:preprotein translocase subunit YajC
METNWLIIIIAIVVITIIIILLLIRNQKDKKELMQNLIDEDNISMSKKPDNEADSED